MLHPCCKEMQLVKLHDTYCRISVIRNRGCNRRMSEMERKLIVIAMLAECHLISHVIISVSLWRPHQLGLRLAQSMLRQNSSF